MFTKVAIVEDNAGICDELEHIVSRSENLECVCVCRNAKSALRHIPIVAPDVVIMDVHLPDGSGIDCTSRLKRTLPDAQILIFTIHDDIHQIVKALEAGASGYLLKNSSSAEIVDAIRDVRTRGGPLSREVAKKLIESFRLPATAQDAEPLTPKETEVLQLLSAGLLYKEIADKLDIKIDTVGTHIKSIYRKLHVRSRTEAVMKFKR